MPAGAAGGTQVPHHVAVRIENADLRNGCERETLLAARFAQQALRRESRGRVITLMQKDPRIFYFVHLCDPADFADSPLEWLTFANGVEAIVNVLLFQGMLFVFALCLGIYQCAT
jgi:hypothetical protein